MSHESKPFSGLTKRVNFLADLVLQNRIARALEQGAARYPIYRVVRFAARIELEVLLDAFALDGFEVVDPFAGVGRGLDHPVQLGGICGADDARVLQRGWRVVSDGRIQ